MQSQVRLLIFARSIDPIAVAEHSITRMAVAIKVFKTAFSLINISKPFTSPFAICQDYYNEFFELGQQKINFSFSFDI